MKILIIRMIAIEEDLSDETYNNQGIGLSTALSDLGHECGLVYYAKKGNAREEEITRNGHKIKVYHVEGLNIVWNAVYNREIYNICDKYDVIQVSECDQIFSWMLYRKYPTKTMIYHGPYKSKYTKKYNIRATVFDMLFTWRAGFKNANVLCKSKLAEEYLRNKGFRNLETVGVGLDNQKIDVAVNKEDIPQKIVETIDYKKDSKYILYIGAISKRKNFKFAIDVLNRIVNEYGYHSYKLIVVGDKAYKEEDYFSECFSLIERLKLSDNVRYLGRVEQKFLKFIYNVSDIYILPTQYDIFGMVYLEAMYYGVPIVTTLCGGSSLLIEDGVTGYVRNIEDEEGWVSAILDNCNSEEQIEGIRAKSMKLIREQFLWKNIAPRFVECYRRTINEK